MVLATSSLCTFFQDGVHSVHSALGCGVVGLCQVVAVTGVGRYGQMRKCCIVFFSPQSQLSGPEV